MATARKIRSVVPEQPLAARPRHRKGMIVGWEVIADNKAGTLARCSTGFVLRTNRYDERGVIQWPCYQNMLTAREARDWLRENVLEVAFPTPARTAA